MKRCALCQIHSEAMLCDGCQTLLQAPENPCTVCAKPLNQAGGVCGECRSDPPAFSHTYCAAIYEAPVSTWVHQLKFGGRLDRARIMAEALSESLQTLPPKVPVIPVPLHPKRLKSRGYNQAHEVARLIAKKQQRLMLHEVLVKSKHTAMQAELPEKQRVNNVRAAFRVQGEIEHPKVLVVDDVMTTGQTLRAVSKCLVQAGVREVVVAVFARSGG